MTSRSPAAPSDPWPRKAFQISYSVADAIADWRALHFPPSQSNTPLLHSSAFRPILRMISYSALQQVRYTIIALIVVIWESLKLGTPAALLSFLQTLLSNLSGHISLFFCSNPANQVCPVLEWSTSALNYPAQSPLGSFVISGWRDNPFIDQSLFTGEDYTIRPPNKLLP
jgi:hypothetical protein